ncbi:MAG: response regulator [Chloroflexi bacterium]|nr:response regulator [Chloroflexota bacterium]
MPVDPRTLPRILYIEDDESSRVLVRRLLSGSYVVLEAADPLNGLQLADETQPNLILLDHNLPHMTGSEVATRLRTMLPTTPLVIVSADDTGARERALAAGAAGFISKPINVLTFEEEVEAYLNGKRERLEQREFHMQAYQQELVERLEANVRQASQSAERNKFLLDQNQRMFAMLERRHKLLETAAHVGHEVTFILDLDELLPHMVDIICNEFDLYYSGVFLVSEDGKWAVLRAGFGDAGRTMLADGFRLPVDEASMIGTSILQKRAQIAHDAAGQESRFKNPHLPNTRSEVALPLIVNDIALGALTVQSAQADAFSEEDITSLQVMADQAAIAISNAQALQKLEEATAEIVRTKTFEAIATATGEAIHWVGNKAAPIPGSVARVRESLGYLLALIARGVGAGGGDASTMEAAQTVVNEAKAAGVDVEQMAREMSTIKPRQLESLLSVESLMEDLQIVERSAVTILNIKEDLIGPARQRNPSSVSLREMLATMIANMGLPHDVVELSAPENLPNALCDARQVEQVFNNLVKNAWEALNEHPAPKILVRARRDDDPKFLLVSVRDNGAGIPKELQDRIWMSFFTTKGGRGGTGLGLSACMQIVNQNRGRIWMQSEPGHGAEFFVLLPVAQE